MHYVIAYDDYYPRGGFKDIMFKGSFEDCELVKESIVRKRRYDRVLKKIVYELMFQAGLINSRREKAPAHFTEYRGLVVSLLRFISFRQISTKGLQTFSDVFTKSNRLTNPLFLYGFELFATYFPFL